MSALANLKEAKKDEYKVKKDDVINLLGITFFLSFFVIVIVYLLNLEEEIVKTDFENRGLNPNNLPGRIFPANEMIYLLQQAGIHKIQKDGINRVIDQIGVYLAKTGKIF